MLVDEDKRRKVDTSVCVVRVRVNARYREQAQ